MKHFGCIFIFIISFLRSDSSDLDVKHMIVGYKGTTTECFVDSIGYQYLYFVPKDSVDSDSIKLKDVYYIYNDFDRVFHYSWSFEESVRRMENRTGKLFTIKGDTIDFIDIQFNDDMINPEIFVKTGKERSEFISMLDIEKIETDFSIMSYSVERGFYYSYYSFLLLATLDIFLQWDKERRAIPQMWDQYNDLMPAISPIGFNKKQGTGVTYQSFTSLIPISVLISMVYDVFKEKNKFYFTPIYEEKEFGRNMYIFSLRQVINNQLKSIVFKLEKTKFGSKVIGWFR